MKSSIKYFMLAISVVFFFGCKKEEKLGYTKNAFEYQEYFIPQSFDYFSKDIYETNNIYSIIYPSAIFVEGYCGINFKIKYSDDEFSTLQKDLISKSIYHSKLKDTIGTTVPDIKKQIKKSNIQFLT